MQIKELFTEKFRPNKIDQLIVPSRIKKQLEKGLVQNLLLYGTPGNGKTSTLFILAKNHSFLYINASSERGIDTIREKISSFCSSISLEAGKEKLKCVILDELDGATEEFYKALRAVMERFAGTTRFIASCNYLNKIPEPIWKSRFLPIPYDPINKEEEDWMIESYKKRVGLILNAIKIEWDEEVLDRFVRNEFPDMRSLLNKIQSLYIRGADRISPDNIVSTSDFKELFDITLKKNEPWENYRVVVNGYGTRIEEAFTAFGEDFPEFLKNKAPEKIDKLPLCLIAIAEYQYQKGFVVDPMITLLALVFKLQSIL